MTDSIDTLLPDPDSPTSANVSLDATDKLIPLTARTVSAGNSNRTWRFSISRSTDRSAPDASAGA